MQIIRSNELVDYPSALSFMENRVDAIIEGTAENTLWLLEHPPLYTSGTSAKISDLLQPEFPVYKAGRGGEYTYHGPGQRVVYVMRRLEKHDLRAYVRDLEQWIINTLAHFGIMGERREGRIGIWVAANGSEAKIAALGIRVRKWVAYHGIAINVKPDLRHFGGIVPCGISEFGVTSFEKLGVKVSLNEVDEVLIEEFIKLFKN